ncbi:hydroxylysine kinase-like [Clavelina lepadiformis]|uniref:hydroxylysine kinase-like n=1 Tax=Clavelina lepadiformis TaxID=159417 RepID=UPI00404312F0
MDDFETIREVLRKTYNILDARVTKLNGYLDKNFWVKDDKTSKQYILRIICQKRFTKITKRMDALINHLHSHGFKVPTLLRTNEGRARITEKFANNSEGFVERQIQVSDFISGRSVFESDLNPSDLVEIANDVGMLGGLVNKCISEKFSINSLIENTDDEDSKFIWFTENFYDMKIYLPLVRDAQLQKIISQFFELFKTKVPSQLKHLRYGLVHGDFSDMNIILTDESSDEETRLRSSVKDKYGIIDFEHCHHSPVVFDLTVCMAYMMTKAASANADPMLVGGNVLDGFRQNFPLNKAEKDILFCGVMARLVSSFLMSLHSLELQPENKGYVTGQSSQCPQLIRMLWMRGEHPVTNSWLPGDNPHMT